MHVLVRQQNLFRLFVSEESLLRFHSVQKEQRRVQLLRPADGPSTGAQTSLERFFSSTRAEKHEKVHIAVCVLEQLQLSYTRKRFVTDQFQQGTEPRVSMKIIDFGAVCLRMYLNGFY